MANLNVSSKTCMKSGLRLKINLNVTVRVRMKDGARFRPWNVEAQRMIDELTEDLIESIQRDA